MGFVQSHLPFQLKLRALAVRDSFGKPAQTPMHVVPSMLGEWGSYQNDWTLNTALLLGMGGKKGDPVELAPFCFSFKEHKILLRGELVFVDYQRDPASKELLAWVYVSANSCLWMFVGQSQLLEPAKVFFLPMPEWAVSTSFPSTKGYDFGLDKFCEPKVGPADGEKSAGKPEAGQAKACVGTGDGLASLVNLAKLKKSPLQLPGMKKAHTAWFCVEHVVGPYLETVSESAGTLVKIGDEILPLLDPATIATWTTQLGGVKASLETFEKRFFSGDDPVSGFGEPLDWPAHTAKFNATRLAPQLVSEMVASSKIFPAIPEEFKPLFDRELHVCEDTGGFLMASYLRGVIEDLGTFLELITAKS